jgi:hypothetical protein
MNDLMLSISFGVRIQSNGIYKAYDLVECKSMFIFCTTNFMVAIWEKS